MREFLSRHEIGKSEGFRWRGGGEISRMEGFSDAVFGFAVTLLVVSLEVPKTFNELMESMRGFAGFAAAFAVLFIIWLNQYKFFRRYGLQDGPTLWLNALLLFLVVFFVYPLKFLFTWLFRIWSGAGNEIRLPNGEWGTILNSGQERTLMLIYGAGYAAVFSVFAMMHWRAFALRGPLGLSPVETFDTMSSVWEAGLQIAIAALSIGLALSNQTGWAGLSFCLIAPVLTVNGFWRGSLRKKLMNSGLPAGLPSVNGEEENDQNRENGQRSENDY